MAGPTPVSALIHAATMVTAGVYLVCRMSSVFVLSPAAMFTVAVIGARHGALRGDDRASSQNDIKKVLAYSTVSQLGFMFLGVGVGAFTAGFFHVHHARLLQGLPLPRRRLGHPRDARAHPRRRRVAGHAQHGRPPEVHAASRSGRSLASWAAIVGFPLTSGFFSKDEILLAAHTSHHRSDPRGDRRRRDGRRRALRLAEWAGTVLYALGLAGAVMTAFYMTRLFIGIFFGEFRAGRSSRSGRTPAATATTTTTTTGKPLEGPGAARVAVADDGAAR